MHRHLGRIPVPVMPGGGAAFDFHTGGRKWAPKWVRAIGMECLWRLCTGGRRAMVRNAICVSHVAAMRGAAYLARIRHWFAGR